MIYIVHTAPRTGGTVLCRHLAHRYNAINFDEWLMELALTQPGARKIPPIGWKPQEFPKEMTPEEMKDLFWFMHEMDQKEVALKEKSDYITKYLDYNSVVKMSSKNREQYLVEYPHINIFNYRRDLLASACSWLIGVLGLHVGSSEHVKMHWTQDTWDSADKKIEKYDLSSGKSWDEVCFLLEPWMSSQWVWFNKALQAKEAQAKGVVGGAQFLVYEDWADNQEEVFPDSPAITTIKTPVPYTDMLSDRTIARIDMKIKSVGMWGAFKDNDLL